MKKKCLHCLQPFYAQVIRKNKHGTLTIVRTRQNICERCKHIQMLRRARWHFYYQQEAVASE